MIPVDYILFILEKEGYLKLKEHDIKDNPEFQKGFVKRNAENIGLLLAGHAPITESCFDKEVVVNFFKEKEIRVEFDEYSRTLKLKSAKKLKTK